jgi:hypothetical protein
LGQLARGKSEKEKASLKVQAVKGRLSKTVPLTLSQPTQMASTLTPQEVQWNIADGPAVKLFIQEEGWYQVGQPDLVAAGLSPSINPKHLQLYADGKQQAIGVRGQKDEQFGPKDAIEFYGAGLDTPSTDTKVYWLVVRANDGKRIQTSSIKGSQGAPSSFRFTMEKKPREYYFTSLSNGDAENFFGPMIWTTPVEEHVNIQHLAPAPRGNAVLEVALQGGTDGQHNVQILLNGMSLGNVVFDGQSRGIKQFAIPSGLVEGDNVIRLIAQGGTMDVSLLDYLRLTYWHTYTADNDVLKFTAQGGKKITLSGFSSQNIRVVDITNPDTVIEVTGKVAAVGAVYSIAIGIPGSGTRTLLAFTDEQIGNPAGMTPNKPSSWHETTNAADLVIISHSDFLGSLADLQLLRQGQGWTVALVDVEDVYDEFGFGAKSPQALRDFLYRARYSWQKPPVYVLLVGNASYDPRNYLGLGNEFVPTKLIDTRYGETASDDWFSDFYNDGLPEMAAGRFAVSTAGEAATVVSKIVGYEQATGMNVVLLVSDENADFDFEKASLEVGALLPPPPAITVKQIFRGTYPDDNLASQDLINSLNEGPLLVNYIGHGGVDLWRGDILNSQDAAALTNGQRLPFVVGMSCLAAMFQDPESVSLAEALMNAQNGGAVAVWTSSGWTVPEAQIPMNKELIRLLFNGQHLTLGEATVRAKAATTDMDVRRTWILFGDPTTKLK